MHAESSSAEGCEIIPCHTNRSGTSSSNVVTYLLVLGLRYLASSIAFLQDLQGAILFRDRCLAGITRTLLSGADKRPDAQGEQEDQPSPEQQHHQPTTDHPSPSSSMIPAHYAVPPRVDGSHHLWTPCCRLEVVWTRDRHVLPDDGHGCRGRCAIIRGPRAGLTHRKRGRLSYFVSPTRLLTPVREHSQLLLRLKRIVGLENDSEVVLAFHAFMHHELHREIGLLTWLQGRRTDDNSGRSAALDDFGHRWDRDRQWLVAGVG